MKQKPHIFSACLRYCVVGLIAVCAAYVAVDQRGGGTRGHGLHDQYAYTFGWPFVAGTHHVSQPILVNPLKSLNRTDHWDFNGTWVVLDAVVFALVVGCSFVIARRWPQIRLRRFSLSTLFVATVVVAALTMLFVPIDFNVFSVSPPDRAFQSLLRSSSVGGYYPIDHYPPWISVPVLCGVTCVLIVLASLLTQVMRWLTRFLGILSKCPFHRSRSRKRLDSRL